MLARVPPVLRAAAVSGQVGRSPASIGLAPCRPGGMAPLPAAAAACLPSCACWPPCACSTVLPLHLGIPSPLHLRRRREHGGRRRAVPGPARQGRRPGPQVGRAAWRRRCKPRCALEGCLRRRAAPTPAAHTAPSAGSTGSRRRGLAWWARRCTAPSSTTPSSYWTPASPPPPRSRMCGPQGAAPMHLHGAAGSRLGLARPAGFAGHGAVRRRAGGAPRRAPRAAPTAALAPRPAVPRCRRC